MADRSRLLLVVLAGMLLLTACGSMKPVPAEFNPSAYTPIQFSQLLHDGSLHAGQLVQVEAYFWQFLTYDPAPEYYYFYQLRHFLSWDDQEWFALYEKADMRVYYDRGFMSHLQRLYYNPKRLDHLIVYGEMLPLGGRKLYLRVHHLVPIKVD